jgi:hypothetical protein
LSSSYRFNGQVLLTATTFCPTEVKLAFPVSFPDLMPLSSRLPDELRTMRTLAAPALCRAALTLATGIARLRFFGRYHDTLKCPALGAFE